MRFLVVNWPAAAKTVKVSHRRSQASPQRFLGEPGAVRRQHHLGQGQKRVVLGKGFLVEDVQARAGKGAAPQGPQQGAFVDQPASRRINDDGPCGKAREGIGVKHSGRGLRQGEVQGEHVALGQKIFEGSLRIGRRMGVLGAKGNRRTEGIQDRSQLLSCGAPAHQPHAPTIKLPEAVLQFRGQGPTLALAHRRVELGDLAQGCEHERQGVLRYRRRITPGEIADRDASGGGGLAIDGVHAYPNFLDEAKLWSFL